MDQTDTFQFLFLKVHFVLILPGSPTSDTPVRVGRLYLCTPLRYMHGYDAVRPPDLSVKSFHINSMALKDGFAPKGAELTSLRK